MEGCRFCNVPINAMARRSLRIATAPLTPEEALSQELVETTGWEYVRIENRFCPMCGKELEHDGKHRAERARR